MGESAGLSPNRAKRTAQIFNKYRCAAATVYYQEIFQPPSAPPDMQQFRDHAVGDGYRQLGYLSPASFHYAPAGAPLPGPGANVGFSTPVQVGKAYRPRLDLIGLQPSAKVLAADGTRYLAKSGTGSVLDFDPDCSPGFYGSFLAAGPIFNDSVEYGLGTGGQGAQGRHKLSFRHAGLAINIAYFDGHVGLMKAEAAWTDAAPWYPGGSRYNGGGATTLSTNYYIANPQFRDIP
jgi:prepilin-type processing-associated H-X9-DG protein